MKSEIRKKVNYILTKKTKTWSICFKELEVEVVHKLKGILREKKFYAFIKSHIALNKLNKKCKFIKYGFCLLKLIWFILIISKIKYIILENTKITKILNSFIVS